MPEIDFIADSQAFLYSSASKESWFPRPTIRTLLAFTPSKLFIIFVLPSPVFISPLVISLDIDFLEILSIYLAVSPIIFSLKTPKIRHSVFIVSAAVFVVTKFMIQPFPIILNYKKESL